MVNKNFSEAITEVLLILKNTDVQLLEKLPQRFIAFLNENKSDTYNPMFDYTRDIKVLNLKKETKNLLAIMYLKYWCTPEEKIIFLRLLNENNTKYEKELEIKYNPDNFFKRILNNKI